MAWTSPITFVAATALTAAQLNTYLRDNFLETAPAKATTAGSLFVSTGPNQIAERPVGSATVAATETTSSTTYTNLATVGPVVTLTTGSNALIFFSARQANNTVDIATFAAVTVSGASTIAAADTQAYMTDGISANNANRSVMSHYYTNLTPGSNTFTLQYKVTSNTGTWLDRWLFVAAL